MGPGSNGFSQAMAYSKADEVCVHILSSIARNIDMRARYGRKRENAEFFGSHISRTKGPPVIQNISKDAPRLGE